MSYGSLKKKKTSVVWNTKYVRFNRSCETQNIATFFFFLNFVISFCIVINFLRRWFHIISYSCAATMQLFKFVLFFNSLYKLYLKFNVNISIYLCICWSGGLAFVLRLFLSCIFYSCQIKIFVSIYQCDRMMSMYLVLKKLLVIFFFTVISLK